MITFASIREFFRKLTPDEIDHRRGRNFARDMLDSGQTVERVMGYAWGIDQGPFDHGIRAEVREHVARLRAEITR